MRGRGRCWLVVRMVLILGSVTTAALVIVGIGTLPIVGVIQSDRGWRSVVAAGSE